MKRNYEIKWYVTKDTKYGGEPLYRILNVDLPKPTGKTEFDAKKALNLFITNCGNLKKNTIVYIKEFDENGHIGEDIIPSDDENAIVPTKK